MTDRERDALLALGVPAKDLDRIAPQMRKLAERFRRTPKKRGPLEMKPAKDRQRAKRFDAFQANKGGLPVKTLRGGLSG